MYKAKEKLVTFLTSILIFVYKSHSFLHVLYTNLKVFTEFAQNSMYNFRTCVKLLSDQSLYIFSVYNYRDVFSFFYDFIMQLFLS